MLQLINKSQGDISIGNHGVLHRGCTKTVPYINDAIRNAAKKHLLAINDLNSMDVITESLLNVSKVESNNSIKEFNTENNLNPVDAGTLLGSTAGTNVPEVDAGTMLNDEKTIELEKEEVVSTEVPETEDSTSNQDGRSRKRNR